jgi:hypothetical protein
MRGDYFMDKMGNKKFNPKALNNNEIHHIADADLGEVAYGDLTISETLELNKIENLQERGLHILFLMLQKACPTLTLDEVKGFPQGKAARLMDLVRKSFEKQLKIGQ